MHSNGSSIWNWIRTAHHWTETRCKQLFRPLHFWHKAIMQQTVRYLSHPQVLIDPAKPIPNWSLNDVGKRRIRALAAHSCLSSTRHVISSAETKAIETATPLAHALGCEVEIREGMHENDRSATGFLPPEEFESVADQFFAQPATSIKGWETAVAAQRRIVAEVNKCLHTHQSGDVLFVGHGGVGTLLFCHLAGVPISRSYDQGPNGGGCYFEFVSPNGRPQSPWQALEKLMT